MVFFSPLPSYEILTWVPLYSNLQNYGPWFDVAGAGIYSVILIDLLNGKVDLSAGEWTYQVSAFNFSVQMIFGD